MKYTIDEMRYFLKDSVRKAFDFSTTAQSRGLPPPPIQKPCDPKAVKTVLPDWKKLPGVSATSLADAIGRRESRRNFSGKPLALDELSFLLWATQGIRKKLPSGHALRTVPSAGARHSFETYLCVFNVEGLSEGIYRYLPLDHSLAHLVSPKNFAARTSEAAFGQGFAADCAATFVWTTVPERMEWRYGLAAHRVIALDAGHVCQNLYLACEAIGAGTCAIAAYDQDLVDKLIGVDGKDEFTVYMAPVGKMK